MPVETVPIAARVPADLAAEFASAAERHERTVSQALRLAMREHLTELERRDRFSRMSLDELDTYLAGVDDGRPAREPGVVTTTPLEPARHEQA